LKPTREIKTALLVLTAIILFIFGYSFLKGNNLLDSQQTFFVRYAEVDGLTKSAQVTYLGMHVGQVVSLQLAPDGRGIMAKVRLRTPLSLYKNTQAIIYEPGLIGGKQIKLVPAQTQAAPLEDGDTLQGHVEDGMAEGAMKKLAPLQTKLEATVGEATTTLKSVNDILNAQTRQSLKNSIQQVEATLTHFKEVSMQVKALLQRNQGHLDRSLQQVDAATAHAAALTDSLSKAPIKHTIEQLNKTLQQADMLLADLQAGKGSAGKLLKDDALYTNFTKTSRQLELLLEDLRLNPTRYINVSLFGKKNKPYVAPQETLKN